MSDIVPQLKRHRLVPVVALQSAADAVPLAEALSAGGLPVIEVTFRTDAAADAISAIAKTGKMLVGAGTVLNVATAQRAIDAGAAFIVTPGFSAKVVEFCLSRKMPIFPGAATATDLQIAVGEFGLGVVKFFPAEAAGGIPMLKALSAPFPGLKFMPTGGITAANLRAWLELDAVLCCGGSWLATPKLIAEKRFDEIKGLAAESVILARGTLP